jgi:hypothetical protein
MTRTLEIMLKRPLRLNRWLWLVAIRIGRIKSFYVVIASDQRERGNLIS